MVEVGMYVKKESLVEGQSHEKPFMKSVAKQG